LLGVFLEHGQVTQSGGILLQALPDADEAAIQLLEANVRAFGSLTDAMANRGMLENLQELCWGLDFELLTPDALALRLECRCSEAKALDAIAYFSPTEREQMIAEEGGAEVVCHWCNEKRWLNAEKIRSISSNESRCPDCGTLWYREGQATMIRENETCACGRPVLLPA
jgi:molecular chaperone Hsp33